MDKQKDKKPTLEFFPIEMNSPIGIPMVEAAEVHAGFPSPVQDAYMNQPIDLNKVLIFSGRHLERDRFRADNRGNELLIRLPDRSQAGQPKEE